jgi:prevent-host-death family protein
MEQVGVRELKNRLAHYLRSVRKGRSIIVTKRGEPVARLVPLSPSGHGSVPPAIEDRLWELTAQGVISWNGSAFQLPEPAAVNRSDRQISDLVVDDRE